MKERRTLLKNHASTAGIISYRNKQAQSICHGIEVSHNYRLPFLILWCNNRDKTELTEWFRCQEDIKIDLKNGSLTVAYAELDNLPFHIVEPHCSWVTFLDLSHNNIE